MANGYEPLSPLMGALDNLLQQQQRQNAIIKQQGLQGLIEGMQQLVGGIGKGMMVKQERQREDTHRIQDFGARMDLTREADRLEKERARTRALEEQAQLGQEHANRLALQREGDVAAMERAKLGETAATDRAEIASGGRRGAPERWAELFGKGASAVGGGLMSMAELQRKRMADVNRLIIARETNESRERIAEAGAAAAATKAAMLRQDRNSAATIARMNLMADKLWKERQAYRAQMERATMGSLIDPPPALAKLYADADKAYTDAKGALFDAIAKEGVSMEAPPAAPGGITDDDILRALEGGE